MSSIVTKDSEKRFTHTSASLTNEGKDILTLVDNCISQMFVSKIHLKENCKTLFHSFESNE